LRNKKFGLLIYRIAATYLRCSGLCYVGFVANFVLFLAVKKFEDQLAYVLAKLQQVKPWGTVYLRRLQPVIVIEMHV